MAIMTSRSYELSQALEKAGVDLLRSTRILIDIKFDEPVKMYVEYIGDENIIDIVKNLGDGLKVVVEKKTDVQPNSAGPANTEG